MDCAGQASPIPAQPRASFQARVFSNRSTEIFDAAGIAPLRFRLAALLPQIDFRLCSGSTCAATIGLCIITALTERPREGAVPASARGPARYLRPGSALLADQPLWKSMPNFQHRPPLSDELVLQQLGAAAMLCWRQLPEQAQAMILNQANDIIGTTPIPYVRTEIVRLLRRRNATS